MNLMKKITVLAVALFALYGCRGAPVMNVENATVVASVDNVTAKDVGKAIKRAGGGLGWVMQDAGKGHITGTLILRDHRAVVDIEYSAKSYSITYHDSANLDYDGENIHKNYNGWVMNLNKAIQNQLGLL